MIISPGRLVAHAMCLNMWPEWFIRIEKSHQKFWIENLKTVCEIRPWCILWCINLETCWSCRIKPALFSMSNGSSHPNIDVLPQDLTNLNTKSLLRSFLSYWNLAVISTSQSDMSIQVHNLVDSRICEIFLSNVLSEIEMCLLQFEVKKILSLEISMALSCYTWQFNDASIGK